MYVYIYMYFLYHLTLGCAGRFDSTAQRSMDALTCKPVMLLMMLSDAGDAAVFFYAHDA